MKAKEVSTVWGMNVTFNKIQSATHLVKKMKKLIRCRVFFFFFSFFSFLMLLIAARETLSTSGTTWAAASS